MAGGYNTDGPISLPAVISGSRASLLTGIQLTQAAGDVAVFPIPFKCSFYRSGLKVTAAVTGGFTNYPGVKFDSVKPEIGTRGDGDCGNFTLKDAADNTFHYFDLAAASDPIYLKEGDEVVVQLISVGSGGTALPALLVNYIPEMPANNASMSAAVGV